MQFFKWILITLLLIIVLGAGGYFLYNTAYAWGETAGWHQPQLQPHGYHLTFHAPALTLLFVLMALVSGIWTRYLVRCLRSG